MFAGAQHGLADPALETEGTDPAGGHGVRGVGNEGGR
jgi:hypothetical protein